MLTTRAEVLNEFEVSHETGAKLDQLVAELTRWQGIKNLVGSRDLDVLWPRHIADSLQLTSLAPEGPWVDLGSGAGFPGLIAAIVKPDTAVHLIESNARKCGFLRHMARLAAPNAIIHAGRIETTIKTLPLPVATVSARALAPLADLLALSASLLTTGAVGLFPKGRDHAAELTDAAKSWRFHADLIPSRTDSAARIIRVHGFDGQER